MYICQVQLSYFPPGSILAFRVSLPEAANVACKRLHDLLSPTNVAVLDSYFAQTTLVDMNTLLYPIAMRSLAFFI